MARRDVCAGSSSIRSGRAEFMRAKEPRPYLEEKETTTSLMASTDKLTHKILINVTTQEINQQIKRSQETGVQISKI
jgi:hypothetical protein